MLRKSIKHNGNLSMTGTAMHEVGKTISGNRRPTYLQRWMSIKLTSPAENYIPSQWSPGPSLFTNDLIGYIEHKCVNRACAGSLFTLSVVRGKLHGKRRPWHPKDAAREHRTALKELFTRMTLRSAHGFSQLQARCLPYPEARSCEYRNLGTVARLLLLQPT